MEKYDPSQLTEFPRFEPESSQSGVTTFLNKLWKFPIFSNNETNNSQNKSPTEGNEDANNEENKKDEDDSKTETGSYAVEYEGRSLPNVLKRITSLIALGSGGGTKYADTELAQYWMPDDISKECYECAVRFSTLRRKHHCRVCGQIFCSRCCSQTVPGQIFGCAGGLRVCNYCCKVVLSYLKEHEMSNEMTTDLRTLQDSLQAKFPDNKAQLQSTKRDHFSLCRENDTCRDSSRTLPTVSLHETFSQLSLTLPTQQHRYRLVRYVGVWRGCDIQQWMMDNTQHKTRAQARMLCCSLLRSGYIECAAELADFADYALYRPARLPAVPSQDVDSPIEEQSRLVESVSSYCLDLNLDDNSARLIKSQKEDATESPTAEENPIIQPQEVQTEPTNICKAIVESGEDHLKLLMRQCLARQSLASSWLDSLYPLCKKAADIIMPDIYSNEIDVRNYVQIKKVPGAEPKDSCVIHGVVLSKNVAHRGMPQEITNPRILLLDCSIDYQRVEGKFTTLEPVLLQEEEYAYRCAARIASLSPSVVLVRGARIGVREALREKSIAVVTNVPGRAFGIVSRCTQADRVTSIDARIRTPNLGTCKKFYVKNFSGKTLMVLDGCAEPNLGCCILLRGAPIQELIRVKKVVRFMLLACYNWKVEKAFLADIEAVLPENGMTFQDDANDKDVDDASDDNKDVSNVVDSDDSSVKFDDPLLKKSVRKTESDKTLSQGVPIRDFSDPLHSTLTGDDDVFVAKDDEATLKADDALDRWSTDDVVLSMSPNVIIPAPDSSDLAVLREIIAKSTQINKQHTPKPKRKESTWKETLDYEVMEFHPFVREAITTTIDDPKLKASVANFRATGGRLASHKHKYECPLYQPTVILKEEQLLKDDTGNAEETVLDPLSPENHQKMSLLLYTYCAKSPNAPDYCVNPWTVTMEMYGNHDISLGLFLHKYCYDGDTACVSTNCQVPMNQHTRRFVHGDMCITITCNTIGQSNLDRAKQEQNKHVMFWWRCEQCGHTSRGRRLSLGALALSLAALLRLRALARRYVCPPCPHPLHRHTHAFVAGNTSAFFRFSNIVTHDIKFLPEMISVNYDTKAMRDALILSLNDLTLKGHELFSNVSDTEAEREYQNFKHNTEQIHLALTSTSLEENTTLAAVVRSLWSVSDRITLGEKMFRDAQERWSTPHKAKGQQENVVEEKSDVEDSPIDTANNDTGTVYVFGESSKEAGREEHGNETEDEEKGDKKTVRQILSQLLTNNQPLNQNGIIISSGIIPVVVRSGEIGSVIAATLVSITYIKTLRSQLYNRQNEQDEVEAANGTPKDKTDGEKAKSKSNDHIEVLLKDGLLCRVYYAVQFHKLRHMLMSTISASVGSSDSFAKAEHKSEKHEERDDSCDCLDPNDRNSCKSLCDIEEGFVRSVAHSEPWAARGGKSGSTFYKTEDDRYVLKEMTKPEWQQFLEFAPHYFNYVNSCHQNKQPSLLARIVGVFGVGGCGVLVSENVWYEAEAGAGEGEGARFDLKGAHRQRALPLGASAVGGDYHLLKLRWERPLYVAGAAGRALRAALSRDTAFLARRCVMDYSLLLGVGARLQLGLVDYIRTFTWDKRLEHLVKRNLGSGEPTVLSPRLYRRRFLDAQAASLPRAPDHWCELLRPEAPDGFR